MAAEGIHGELETIPQLVLRTSFRPFSLRHSNGTTGSRSTHFRVAAIFRICSGVCSPASGVPGIKYLPMASEPITTGS